MKDNWWKWLIAAGFIGVFVTYCNEKNTETKLRDKERSVKYRNRDDADSRRMHEWTFIAKEKQITPTETVKLVVIPGEYGEDSDVKCLIYTNQDFKQSTFICPGASQDDVINPNKRE